MTTWRPLSGFVRELHETARRLGRSKPTDLRATAAEVVAQRHGPETVTRVPELVNVAALALSLDPLVVHVLSPEAVELAHTTDLHVLPDEPPRLLRRAWLVESRYARGEVLFGDTASLGGYALDGVVYLVGLGLEGWARVARWTPHWIGEEIAAGVQHDTSPLIDDAEAHGGWTREAARFAVVLGLLLDAEGAPTRVTDESERAKVPKAQQKKQKPPPAWVTRYVTLAPEAARHEDRAHAPAGEGAGAQATAGRLAAERPVRGHLKRQPHGPGGKLRRWIYVPGYQARRWVAPAPRKIVVSA